MSVRWWAASIGMQHWDPVLASLLRSKNAQESFNNSQPKSNVLDFVFMPIAILEKN